MYKSNSLTVFGAQTLGDILLSCGTANKVLLSDLGVMTPLFLLHFWCIGQETGYQGL
jgi:hypothetical protein